MSKSNRLWSERNPGPFVGLALLAWASACWLGRWTFRAIARRNRL